MIKSYLFFFAGQFALMLQARYFFQWIIDFAAGSGSSVPIFAGDLIGGVLLGFRVFDAVTDPVAGRLGDSYYASGNSRKGLLIKVAPLLPIGLIAVFFADHSYTYIWNWSVMLFGLFVFFVGYTLYCIPYWSLVDELSGADEHLRATLSSLLGQGLFVATAVGFVCTPALVSSLGHFYGAIIVAAVTTPLLFLPRFADFGKSSISEKSARTSIFAGYRFGDFFKQLIEPLKNRMYSGVLVVFVGSQMAFTLMTSLSAIFVVQVLHQEKSFIAMIMGPVILTAVSSFFFVPKLSKRYASSSLIQVFSGVLALFFLGLFSLSYLEIADRIPLSIVLFACMGPCLAVILGLEAHAVTEASPSGEEVGKYFGTFNFLVKTLNGLALMISGMAVQRFSETQDEKIIIYFLGSGGLITLFCLILSLMISRKN